LSDGEELMRRAAAWRSAVEQQESQAARVREFQPPFDTWAPLAGMFKPGPVTGDVDAVLRLASPDETWLDVGCGAGRIAAHLAGKVKRVLALDSSPAMANALREAAAERALENVKVLPAAPWPLDLESVGEPIEVVLSSHVIYYVPDVMRFIEGMERHAQKRCVMVLGDEAGSLPPEEAWRAAHHEPMSHLPALDRFHELMQQRGIALQVDEVPPGSPQEPPSPDEVFAVLARRCLLRDDSPKFHRLRKWFDEQREATGKVPPVMAMRRVAVCSWEPPKE
jgi:SAM-dependent methyltransferase